MVVVLLALPAGRAAAGSAASLPRPTPEQAAWQDMEIGIFFHFDIPIFTNDNEGDWRHQGHLNPNLYDPKRLNTDQWMEAARALGARYSVFVAKHASGFLSWQSDLYPYGVKQSKWRHGHGDVVRDYVNSCRKYGIKPGLYCSVSANAYWGVSGGRVNWGKGGDPVKQAQYAHICEQMVTQLWGNYGPLTYIWFDGGTLPPDQGGPNLVPILERLQPHAVTFQGPPDSPAGNTRWVGNESGVTSYPTWATVDSPGQSGPGDPNGKIWQPAECDVPLRNHDWFWHPHSAHKLYSLPQLMNMYYKSVGRNCNLIVNAVIDRDGLVPAADMRRLKEFGDEIRRRFGHSLAETSGTGDLVELKFKHPTRINHVILMERIRQGERVRAYVVEGLKDGKWQPLCHGQSIGHKRIERFPTTAVSAVRLRVTKAVAQPLIRRLAVFRVKPRPASGANS